MDLGGKRGGKKGGRAHRRWTPLVTRVLMASPESVQPLLPSPSLVRRCREVAELVREEDRRSFGGKRIEGVWGVNRT